MGIARHVADIRSVTFSGVGAVADNLTYTAAVPEPESYALALAALGVLVGMTRRRAK
ncbi:MAG: PEP-CTERM sorting domain-containing protein [Aquabacterium sp.]|nr:PEP-CTERM sorting domain-containing protein [Aquabacterium sp.]